jgi:hypothetical protein
MPGPPRFGPLLTRRGFLGSSAGLAAAAWLPRFPGAELSPGCDRIAVTAAKWDQVVRPMLSSRYHRLHHCLFHYVRNNWPSLTPAQRNGIGTLGWGAPRSAMERATWDQAKPWSNIYWAASNGSGEDFLYFHRWMIAMVDAELARAGVGPLEPWSGTDALPPPGGGCTDEQVPAFTPSFANPADPLRPVNVTWLQERVQETKNAQYFWGRMNWWQQEYRDRGVLKRLSLGELGSRLESGVHNQMHVRWSAYPSNGMQLIRDESDFRPVWDDPGYDTLFDEYSSHIGPIFFRLHKWIDNRIEDWAEAHAGEVERYTTPYGFDWFRPGPHVQVAEPWTGAWGFDTPSREELQRRLTTMESVTRVMFPPAAQQLRFQGPELERDLEQKRIISIRDMVL